MNKHCYRIIFSRTQGELRVVSELARSCSTMPGQSRGTGGARLWVTVRRAVWFIGLALFTEPVLANGIVADGQAGAAHRPEVIATQNGLPQVNITAPNQAGLSHNKYQQFDVGKQGAILNNSAGMTSTQLAGMIQGNPNLNPNSAPARVILNEVNSNNPSQLRGFLEVAGGKAQVIVANPSGIICNGCGTINAGRMTLTTGKPQLNADGSLAGYQVERGVVRIEGGGLNGDARHDTEYVDILARAVQVNAGVWAKDGLSVTAGRNHISADGKTVTPLGADDKKPELAIDMGQMGGMYSGHIRMIGTEAGVGVRNQGGHLQAAKTLTVSSEGKLSWQSAQKDAVTQAGGDISLAAKESLDYHGKLHSGGKLTVQSREGQVNQSGTLAAVSDVHIEAARGIQSRGHLLAGSNTNSQLTHEANLTLKSQGDVLASGSLLSKKKVDVSGHRVDVGQAQLAARQTTLSAQGGGVGMQQAKIDSEQVSVATAGDIDAQQAQIRAGRWDVSGNNLFNQGAAWSQVGSGENRFALTGQLDNTDGTIEARQLSLNAAALTNLRGRMVALDAADQHWRVSNTVNNNGGMLGANGNLTLEAGRLSNQSGTVKSQSALTVNAAADIDNGQGKLLAGNQLTLNAAGALDNRSGDINGEQLQLTAQQVNNTQGQLIGRGNLKLTARDGVNNQHGLIGAGEALNVHTNGDIDNRSGTVQGDKQLALSARNIDNGAGKLLSGQRLTVNASAAIDNRAGEISAKTLNLQAQRLNNAQGKAIGQQELNLTAKQALDNTQGLLAAGDTLNVRSDGDINNRGGTAQGGKQLTIAAQNLHNGEGKLLSGGQLTLQAADAINNPSGEISGSTLQLNAQRLDNAQGKVIAQRGLDVHARQSLDNKQGLLEAGERLSIRSEGGWDNRAGMAQGGKQVTASVSQLNNSEGKLQSGGALALDTRGEVNNQGGTLTAQNSLHWQGGANSLFNNTGGMLLSSGDLRLNGGQLVNSQNGIIQSQGELALNLTGAWDNQGGKLTGNGKTHIVADSLRNAQGVIQALDTLDMQFTRSLDNGHGRIFSKLSQTLQAQDIYNLQGWMGSQGGWAAVSQHVDNREGSIQSQQQSQLTADTLDNRQGTWQSAGDLALRVAQDVDNRAGKISAQGQLDVQGRADGASIGQLKNAGGQLLAGDALVLQAQAADNTQNGLIYSQKQMLLSLHHALDNRQGRVQSGEGLQLNAETLLNQGGALDSQQQLGLRILGLLDNTAGAVRSNGDQQIAANRIANQQGVFSSRGGIALTAQQIDNAKGTFISQGVGVYRADVLNNQQGKIHSGNALTLQSGQIANQTGQVVSTGKLQINADQLDNSTQGTLSSQDALVVQTDRLNNRDGGLLLGTTDTDISARQLDNYAGRLQSAGSLRLTRLETLDNRQGRILANGALSINASGARTASMLSLLNQQGLVQSGDTLNINTRTLDNLGGTLLSQGALTLAVQQDYTHRMGDTINSNTAVNFSVSGVLTNLTDWLLPGSLTINSAHLTNLGSLVGKTLHLTTGALLNQGRLEADRMTLKVDTLDNSGALMGDDITAQGRIIDNHGREAVMAATQRLNLQTSERLTNRDRGFIYSADSLQLTSDGLIENRASNIEAEGDLALTAARFENLREGLEIEREAETSDYKWHRYNYYWRSYGSTTDPDVSNMTPTTQQLTFRDDAAASSNPYGTLLNIDAAGKRAEVQVKDNKGQLVSVWVNYLALTPNVDGSYDMTFYETRGFRQDSVPTPYHNTVWREHDRGRIEQWDPEKHVDIASAPFVTDYNNFRERTATGTVTTDKLVSAGVGAFLLSGGNMALHIGKQLLNDASTISANGNLTIDGRGDVVNKGYSVNERRQEYIYDHYDQDTNHWHPTFNRDETTALSTIDGIITGNGNVSIQGASITNTTVNQAQISSVEAAQKAAEAERAEWERNPLGVNVEGGEWQSGDTQLAPGGQASEAESGATSPLGRPLLPGELALTEQQHLGQVSTNIPNNALFQQQTAPDSPFLVVTDPRFADKGKFISSDYMLERVGYDPSQVHKRLGDGYYEQRLVREQVLKLTGRQSVRGEDAMAQYQSLMNNGVKVAQDFHLVPGVALTPSQIAALQQDIVWLVSETVDTANGPQTVWVPKVYLANTTLKLTGDGAVIGGGNLQLSAGSINNAGNLFADRALGIDANQFLHQGGDIRADSINVQADSLTLSTNLQDALRQASMSANDITLSGTNITLQGAKLDATHNLSLSASNNLDIGAAKSSHLADLQVISGAMGNRTSSGMETAGERMAQVSGEWQQALGSTLNAGNNLTLKAGQDISLKGSQASAGGQLGVQAGRDLTIQTESTTNRTHLEANSRTSSVSNSREEERLVLSTLSGEQGVTLIAGNNLLAEGAQVDSTSGSIGLSGENVTINAARQQTHDRDSEHTRVGKTKSQREQETTRDTVVGSTLSGQQGVTVIAREGDVTVTGSTLHSEQGALALQAKNDVTINSASETESRFSESRSEKKGFLNKKSSHTVSNDRVTTEQGSLLSGDSVSISAGNDVTLSGSAIAADHDVNLQAGNNVSIVAATESESHYLLEEKKKSGLLSGGGLGFTIGSQSSRHQIDEQGTTQSQSVSTVGSSQGNVNITAGKTVHIGGADLVAGKDMTLSGDSVQIDPGYDKRTRTETFESKQSGLSVALSGAAGGALNTAVNTAQQARKESGGRLQALQGTKAALSGVQAGQAVALEQAKGGDVTNTVGVSASLGSQKSSSESHSQSSTVSGSTLTAGNNLSITATGKGGGAGSGDIVIAGSQLKAGGDTQLSAGRDVQLSGAANTQQSSGKNSSSGFGVGVDVTTAGVAASANANQSRGKEQGNGTQWSETTVSSGGTVNVSSGRDTTLTGAQVSGETVVMEVGRDLTLSSQQDSDRYDAKQNSTSGGISVPLTAGAGGLQASVSRDKLHSNYDSVQEQTGIFAGKGGFDISVGNHTQLDGAVIGSTAAADKNKLDTGTLGFENIENQADFKTEHSGGSLSTGGSLLGNVLSNSNNLSLAGANNSGHAEGTTQSVVSEGSLIIRDTANQQQDVNDLSRDTENANGSIGQIFDKEKEQNRLKEAQLIGEIGGQAMDIVRTQGDINGLEAAREEYLNNGGKPLPENATVADKEAYAKMLRETPTYQDAMKRYGMGSDFQKAAQAVTSALQGLAGGDIAQAVAGGLSPYAAEQIKKYTGTDKTANVLAHAVWGAIAAEMSGNSAAAGAAGAAGGELAARYLAGQLYPDVKPENLSEEQKQNISALSTLAAGLAGGIVGDSSTDAVAGGQAGKNAVENNLLGKALVEGCAIAAPCRSKVAAQVLEIGVKAGITGVVAKEIADKMSAEDLDHLITLKMMGNDEITGKYLSSLQDKYAPSNTGNNDSQVNIGPNHTGNSHGQVNTGPNHTGNSGSQINTGPNHTGGDQSVEQLPSNTGNTEGASDLPTHMESQGYDPRLPIPEATTASNGLKIESNTKHTPGAQGFRPNAGIEPRNSLDLFEHSIATKDPKVRLSIDSDGNIHRFFNTSKDGTGSYHWSGSTGDGKNALGNRELGSFNREIKELRGK
ncbi:hemagglutinin repeat-containing protein [Serratia sp. NPDC078593]|uniref:hemagglutinin repeat-containing protein n=1 Tax=unclassified Serratia (in: enterobacteria) TaxID=2647522 RepID=UPI0037CF3068